MNSRKAERVGCICFISNILICRSVGSSVGEPYQQGGHEHDEHADEHVHLARVAPLQGELQVGDAAVGVIGALAAVGDAAQTRQCGGQMVQHLVQHAAVVADVGLCVLLGQARPVFIILSTTFTVFSFLAVVDKFVVASPSKLFSILSTSLSNVI